MKRSDMYILAAVVYVAPHMSWWAAWPMALLMIIFACLEATKE